MNPRPAIPYVSQFFILIGLTGFFFLFGGILLMLITSQALGVSVKELPKALLQPENVNAARWLQFITTFISFFLPAMIFAVIVSRKPFRYVGFNSKISLRQIFFTVFILAAAVILSNALGELSLKIPFSDSIKNFARELDRQYIEQVKAMARMENLQDYFASLLIIAVLPAVFEEVLFRGCLQNILIGWFKNPFVAILITSILFSAIHLSIFGFLTRVALSMVLGYLFYYTKNIWINILFHFLNNGLAITMAYIYFKKGMPIEKSIETPMPVWYGVIAIAVLLILFHFIRKESNKVDPVDSNEYLKKEFNLFGNS